MYNFLVCKANIETLVTSINSPDDVIFSNGKVIGLSYEPKVSTIIDTYRLNNNLGNNVTVIAIPLIDSNLLKVSVIENTLKKNFGYNEIYRFNTFFADGIIIDSMIDESQIKMILPSWSNKAIASRNIVYTNFT